MATDEQKIAKTFGLTVDQLRATTPDEKDDTIRASLTKDERSIARAFGMKHDAVAELVTDNFEGIEPTEAAAKLSALGKEGQGRLLALNPAAALRLLTSAAKKDAQWIALRDATARLITATNGRGR